MNVLKRTIAAPVVWAACLGIALAILPVMAGAAENSQLAKLKFVPWPHSVQLQGGEMTLNSTARIACADPALLPLGKILSGEITKVTGLRLQAVGEPAQVGDIELAYEAKLRDKAYTLTISDKAGVVGTDYNAVATGTVTLLQAIDIQDGKVTLPRLTIRDWPGLKYCGFMLDIARKPHSIATLKQCVEAARFYKIRYFHLHMSDENAWTFPSTKYPQLGSQNFAWAGGEKPTVYKIQELKDLVAYADARGVTLVPEIETPGHSGQMRGSLPQIFGYKTADGKIESPGIINIASEEAFKALDILVGEFADVFKSSPFIHIGCDEASAEGIEKYPAVKELMEKENLKSGGDVFNYYLNRMAGIVKKHGRRMIIWTGGPNTPKPLPKDVIWMPWRGGAGELVREGYFIINPPWGVSAPYFDPWNCNGMQFKKGEPKVFGATALLWQGVQEIALPAIRTGASLRNEPTWNPDANKGISDLTRRLGMVDGALDKLIYGFAFKTEGAIDPQVLGRAVPAFTGKLTLTLDAPQGGRVRYTLDGSDPTPRSPICSKPVTLTSKTTLKARWFGNEPAGDKSAGVVFSREYFKIDAIKHDAVNAKIKTSVPPDPSYYGAGPLGLVDGLASTGDSYSDAGWVGWLGVGLKFDITLDLKKSTAVKNVRAHFLQSMGGVGLPKGIEVALSGDGQTFTPLGACEHAVGAVKRGWYSVEPSAKAATARFVRVTVTSAADWTFIDEVTVNSEVPLPNLPHAAVGKEFKLATQPNPDYASSGVASLTDGYVGPTPQCPCVGWLGFMGVPVEAVIDMGKPTDIKSAGGHFMQMVYAGVYIPQKLEVMVSNDGRDFRSVGSIVPPREVAGDVIRTLRVETRFVLARYVKIKATGNGQWLFTDELFVNPLEAKK